MGAAAARSALATAEAASFDSCFQVTFSSGFLACPAAGFFAGDEACHEQSARQDRNGWLTAGFALEDDGATCFCSVLPPWGCADGPQPICALYNKRRYKVTATESSASRARNDWGAALVLALCSKCVLFSSGPHCGVANSSNRVTVL
jgi:hypothetical protein